MRDDISTTFLDGGGQLGELIRNHDWESTPLGSPDTWPQSLRSALSICLQSSYPTAIYWGPELRLLYNDAWSPIPAERHPDALGRPGAEVWPDIWDVVGPQFRQVIETGEGFSTYDQMLPMVRNGVVQETYWNYSFTAIRGEDGEVAGIFNQGNETTEQVLARRQAEEDVERFGYLFEQAPGAVAILRGPKHVFEIVNPAYEVLIGRRDIVGKPVAEALPEVVSQGFVDLLDQVYRSGEPYRGHAMPVVLDREQGPEERNVDFVFQPVTDTAGKRYGVFVQATDVTDTIRAEGALRDSEERYHAIVNSIDQMIWSTRPDGYHDYYNDRWYEFTGVPHGTTDGEEWNGMFHPDDQERAWAVWRHSLETGEPYHIEYRLRHRSGQYRWVIGRAQCVRGPDGKIARWYGTCTDIHDLKVAEDARQLVLRELNHRVKNLFSIVAGMVSITARSTTTAAEMGDVLRGRLHALSTAHDLIRVGSSLRDAPSAAPLAALVSQIVKPHVADEDQVALDGPEMTVGEDASTGLALILHELATNAAKYGAFRDPEGTLAVRWHSDGETLTVAWEETCPGLEIRAPETVGFGSRLVASTVEGQLGGSIDQRWEESGVKIALRLPAGRIVAGSA
ncbi:PAS domain-containing protein [Rhodobacterales bacterium HKCCE2091]|nr:PAS domain-containing protein [Rhodobacterales bacterium HKCCE2091]